MSNKISESERIFIIHGVDLGIRSDGRSCLDYRTVMLEQNVIETCNGSAHVRSGNTDVLVGIKLELEEVDDPQSWDGKGKIQLFADISAIASPAFEGKKGEDMTYQLEVIFSDFLPEFIELDKLVVVEKKSYFVMHIDVVILECSSFSSLIDITSIAIKTALYDVRIPKIVVISAEHNEFKVSDDEFDSISLDASKVPLVTSYTKIGSKFVVDASWEEEQASVGTVAVAFSPPNEIALTKKIRSGSISNDSFSTLYENAIQFGLKLSQKFNDKHERTNLKNNGKITFSLD